MAVFARTAICAMALSLITTPLLAQLRRAPAQPARVQPPAAAPAPVPAAPPTPDLPRATFIATMDSQFRAQDPDSDGRLTRAEIEAGERAKLFAAAQANNRALFARLDADRNGHLSPAEFAGMVQQPAVPDVSQTMNRLDLNRDQVVTLVEYRAATLANFDRLDADHDGVVTDLEMRSRGVPPAPR